MKALFLTLPLALSLMWVMAAGMLTHDAKRSVLLKFIINFHAALVAIFIQEGSMRRKIAVVSSALAVALVAGQAVAFDLGGLVKAGSDVVKAVAFTDEEAKNLAGQAREHMDNNNKLASASDKYGQRLMKVVKGLNEEDGLKLNFKVYLVKEINAFAMADGTVRVFAGLMDKMSDDELRYVIGHEIGHVKLGHSKKAMQTAYLASGARKAAVASGNSAAATLSASELGGFTEALVNAQFSQSQENDADAYAVKFMKKHKYDPKAAVSALKKLEELYGSDSSLLASHPGLGDRAKKVEKSL